MIWNMFGEILTFFPLKKNSHTELPYIRVKKVYKICDLVDFSGIYSLAFIFGADPYLYNNKIMFIKLRSTTIFFLVFSTVFNLSKNLLITSY